MILSGMVRSRLRMARNQIWPPPGRGGRPAHRGQRVFLALIPFGFAAFVFGSLVALFSGLDTLGLGLERASVALAWVLAGAVMGMLIFDLHYAVTALLLDSDLQLLRRAPLSPGQLLGLKIADSMPRTWLLAGVLALPGAVAFGWSHPPPWWGWLLLPLQLMALWMMPLGIGLCGALAIVRWVPARHAREALALLSTFFLMGIWIVNSFVLPRAAGEGGEWLPRLAQALAPAPWMGWVSPPHWAAFAMAAAAAGETAHALGWTLALVAGGTLSLMLAGTAAGAMLDETLVRVSVPAAPVRRRRSGRAPTLPAAGMWALLRKDVLLFSRDWTVLGDVFAAALLWTLLPLVSWPLHAARTAWIVRAMLVSLTVGLGYEVGARAVPFERAGLAWARLAPVPPLRWNLGKLASGAAVSLPFVLIAGVTARLAIRTDGTVLAEALVVALSGLSLSLSLGLWTGWKFGDPRWTNPRAMQNLAGRITSSLLLVAQGAMWLALLALAEAYRDRLPAGIVFWGAPLLAAGLSALLVARANHRMERFEWTS